MTKLDGGHCIVIGGSEGIGAAVAEQAVRKGATVTLMARRGDLLAETADRIGAAGWRAVDVTDGSAVLGAVSSLCDTFGPCRVLVDSAGFALPGRFDSIPVEEFRSQMDVNFFGAVHATKAAAAMMVPNGGGHIVLVSSTVGLLGVVGYSSYAPTKWAVRGFAESVRYELEPVGVKVSVVYPPDTLTPGFDKENERKPPETVAVSGSIKPRSADTVAAKIIRGIERNKRDITADPQTRLLTRWGDALSPGLRVMMNRQIRAVRSGTPTAPSESDQ